jgi:hypothetical protein
MIGLFRFALSVLASPFKSKLRLEAENAVLRHQLMVLRRRPHGRVQLTNHDRLLFIQRYRWFPAILKVLTIIRPETLVRWHRAGFRCYWRWKSRPRGGRPQIDTELRALVRRMSLENPLWGAPRIHDGGHASRPLTIRGLIWINATGSRSALPTKEEGILAKTEECYRERRNEKRRAPFRMSIENMQGTSWPQQ